MSLKNNKSLGQHWLKDRAILDEIAEEALVVQDDPEKDQPFCIEIGPGLGTLTSALLRNFPKVIAIEFDERLAKNLPNSFPGKNLDVRNEDILKFDFSKINEPYVVAGNIPYYITSPIITKLLELKNPPLKIVLLIQKEVADRILAEKGDHTILSLTTQNRAKVSPGIDVPREYFTPPPRVDSATIILEPLPENQVSEPAINLAKIGFSSPRKKLINNLSGANLNGVTKSQEELRKIFKQINFDENLRPADLSLDDWQLLHEAIANSQK